MPTIEQDTANSLQSLSKRVRVLETEWKPTDAPDVPVPFYIQLEDLSGFILTEDMQRIRLEQGEP